MSGETVEEVKNEEVTEIVNNEVIEETNEETQLKDASPEARENRDTEEATKQEEIKTEVKDEVKPKTKATPKKLARTVKVVELVECEACNKKMLPKSLKNTHPHYCKGQPTETLPINKQKASYGSKVEQKLRKEIEEEMKTKYLKQEQPKQEQIKQQQTSKPVRMEQPEPPRQPTARELLASSYNEIRRAKQQGKDGKDSKVLKRVCFNY